MKPRPLIELLRASRDDDRSFKQLQQAASSAGLLGAEGASGSADGGPDLLGEDQASLLHQLLTAHLQLARRSAHSRSQPERR